ncbi:MAG: bifunctional diaminohydroxyphosphoribosylaminopyrimidine deaminase/5-amino-6-(5-phosphoribosylamino)uracil reductase RibD [Chloroflexi bacterium]|nr:bifunctional diaminohydroxyphosphoribosylaminopyrimidine deaminase/5-amino-6-(5-phosphoribosylamino)uracil reductase RibD [Chloroflexota bacterium]
MSNTSPMQRAIWLARQALGNTSPNPAVGAVIVRDEAIVGEGFTLPPGQRHAEIGALEQAGTHARGATLFTTLEPCCHHGRTPPCTEAVIAAGIKEVVAAAVDPNPLVAGRGMDQLREAGIAARIESSEGVTELYEAFSKHINTGLPFVTAKFAMSLDGKIATYTGDSKWVTGPLARQEVQLIRRECDAVMVGINTVLADDPQLTVRDEDGKPEDRQPLRVVLDSHCRTPSSARMLREPGETLVVTSGDASGAEIERLRQAGAEIWLGPLHSPGMVEMSEVLVELGQRGVVNLLVEGGGITLGTLFDGGLVDKVKVFIAPTIIGGSMAASPIEGHGPEFISQAWHVEETAIRQIGPDWLITGYPTRSV